MRAILLPAISLFLCSLNALAQEMPGDSIYWSIDLDNIVVTAQYAPTESANSIHPIRSITQKTIQQRGANNLEELLTQELNIRIQQDLILGSSLSLQGISGQNVKIMIDGVPVIGRVGDNVDLSQINLYDIARVEIVEGPMSVNYGTNALGGVINLITKKSQINTLETGVLSQVESVGKYNLNAHAGYRLTPNLMLRLSGGIYEFNPVKSDSARSSVWNPKSQEQLGAKVRYFWGTDHSLLYTADWFREKIDDLGEIRCPQFKPYALDDYYLTRRMGQTLQHDGTCAGKFYVQSVAGYNYFERMKHSFREDMETHETQQIFHDQDTSVFQSAMARSSFSTLNRSSKWNYQAGIDLNYETAQGTRLALEEGHQMATIFDAALFGSLTWDAAPSFSTQLGLRGAFNNSFRVPLTPSFHFKWNPNKVIALKGSYARGFRSPTLKELYFNFVDQNHYIVGNTALVPEHSHNFQMDASFRKKVQQWEIDFSVKGFYNQINNKIDLYLFDQGSSTLRYGYFNRETFKSLGSNIRLGLSSEFWTIQAGVLPLANYNLLSENFDGVTRYSLTTEWNGEVRWRYPKYQFSIAGMVRYNDKLVRPYLDLNDDGEQIVVDRVENGFTMLDLTMNKAFWSERLSLCVGAKNMLDIRQIATSGSPNASNPHVGSGESMDVNLGRSFFVRLNFNFGIGKPK